MSYPDKLIVSGAGSGAVNGEYLRDDIGSDVRWRMGSFIVTLVDGRWLLRYLNAPAEIIGFENQFGYFNASLTGQYNIESSGVVVYGAGVEAANGIYVQHPSGYYYNPASLNWIIQAIVPEFSDSDDATYEIRFSGSSRYYSTFYSINPWDASPYETNSLGLFGAAPSVINGASFFLSPAPFVEAVFNPPPAAPEPADLLPPSATAQERALSKATARAGTVPVQIKQVWSPETCPAGILPWLAWSLSVDQWSSAWTEQQKRDAIASAVSVHRVKGTLGALRRALQAIGYEVKVNEQTGEAYTFTLAVNVGEAGVTNPALFDEVERIALSAKNVRSHLLGVNALGVINGGIRLNSAGIDGCTTRVWPDIVDLLESTAALNVRLTEQSFDWVKVAVEEAPAFLYSYAQSRSGSGSLVGFSGYVDSNSGLIYKWRRMAFSGETERKDGACNIGCPQPGGPFRGKWVFSGDRYMSDAGTITESGAMLRYDDLSYTCADPTSLVATYPLISLQSLDSWLVVAIPDGQALLNVTKTVRIATGLACAGTTSSTSLSYGEAREELLEPDTFWTALARAGASVGALTETDITSIDATTDGSSAPISFSNATSVRVSLTGAFLTVGQAYKFNVTYVRKNKSTLAETTVVHEIAFTAATRTFITTYELPVEVGYTNTYQSSAMVAVT